MHNETHELIRQVFNRLMQELANLRHEIRHHFRNMEMTMSADTNALVAEVRPLIDAGKAQSLVLAKIFAMIDSAPDIAAVRAATAELKAATPEIIAATLANTPADPAAPVDPNAPPVDPNAPAPSARFRG